MTKVITMMMMLMMMKKRDDDDDDDLDDDDELDYDDDIPEDNDKNNEESKPDARNDRSDNPNKTRSRWMRWNQVAINLCCGKLDDGDYDVDKDGIIDDHDLI